MSEVLHHIDVVLEDFELRVRLRCTGAPDAQCRRRPPNWEERESWPIDEATETGFECWAVQWVEDVGERDAFSGFDGLLGSIPVHVSYEESVALSPVVERETLPIHQNGSQDA